MKKLLLAAILALALPAFGQSTSTNPGITGVFNPAAPGAIGATTPSTGLFTTVTATSAVTGGIAPLTGANTSTSSTAVGILASLPNSAQGIAISGQTVTAAGSGFTLLQLATGNGSAVTTNQFLVLGNGAIQAPSLSTTSSAQTGTICWTTGTGNFTVDTTTTCLLSSARFKERSRPLNVGLRQVMQLRPVSYYLRKEYNPTGLGEQIGLLAEDVAKVDDRLIARDEKGRPKAVRYQQTVALLVKAIQEQQREINQMRAELRVMADAMPEATYTAWGGKRIPRTATGAARP